VSATFLLRVQHCCSKYLDQIPSGKCYMQVFQMISIKNAHTIRCNTKHVLDDLDVRGEMKPELLNAIFDIVDGCAVQY
jgi:hypothetical protein